MLFRESQKCAEFFSAKYLRHGKALEFQDSADESGSAASAVGRGPSLEGPRHLQRADRGRSAQANLRDRAATRRRPARLAQPSERNATANMQISMC